MDVVILFIEIRNIICSSRHQGHAPYMFPISTTNEYYKFQRILSVLPGLIIVIFIIIVSCGVRSRFWWRVDCDWIYLSFASFIFGIMIYVEE